MTLSRLFVVTALATSTVSLGGCNVLMRFMGDATANLITSKTADLKDVSAQVSYTTNLYPLAAKTIETDLMAETWTPGGNMVNAFFLKRQGVGMLEIDGTVTARKGPKDAPVPMTYMGKGSYMLFLPAGDRAPRVIEVKTATGQTTSFLAKPTAPVTIKAVNGKPANASVDLTKDLVIDLADVGPGRLKVSMASSVFGIRTFTDVVIAKPAKRIVVPAAAFRHLGVSASVENLVGVDPGANYVLVERYETAPVTHGAVGAVQGLSRAWSNSPVTVTKDVKNARGIALTGSANTPHGAVSWTIDKSVAFYAPPITHMKKPVIGQLAVRASLYKQSTATSQSGNIITTTTTTYAFPTVAPAAWDRLLDDAASNLRASVGAPGAKPSFIATEKLTATSGYADLEPVKEAADEKYVERTYRGGRNVFPESFAGLLSSVSSTFAADRPVVRMMTEAGADAVISSRINLQVGSFKDSGKLALIPGMTVMVVGGTNGYTVGPTNYYTATVSAKEGVTFSQAELEDVGALRRIARLDDLAIGLRAAVAKLREEERKGGYDAIWALQ